MTADTARSTEPTPAEWNVGHEIADHIYRMLDLHIEAENGTPGWWDPADFDGWIAHLEELRDRFASYAAWWDGEADDWDQDEVNALFADLAVVIGNLRT